MPPAICAVNVDYLRSMFYTLAISCTEKFEVVVASVVCRDDRAPATKHATLNL